MNFFDKVLDILKSDERFFTAEGNLLRNAVYEAAMQMDPILIKNLYNNEETKKRFFADIDGIAVFDKVGFAWVINNREFLTDSYTRYKNKIGLVNQKGEYLSCADDIELVFPYKDCVLEGGQTKEDRKRSEIFYNETLAPDDVDRLLSPKVLSSSKKYTKAGISSVTSVSMADNLIINGNNLLALSSLLPKYKGRIKCIYIDPPYYFAVKKDEDTFEYNSDFKLSSWLVFMKNRLEIARELLSQDGSIFVQINDDGAAELHRLMKDIFCRKGENNFINKITVKTKSPSGFASVNPGVFETAEYILAFAKNKRKWKYNPQYVKSEYDNNYKWLITNKEDDCSEWKFVDLFEYVAKKYGYESKKAANIAFGENVFLDMVGKFALENAENVFQLTAIGDNSGQEVVNARELSKVEKGKVFSVKRDNHYDVYILNGRELAFYSKKIRVIDGVTVPSTQLTNIWIDTPYEGIAKEGGVKLKGGKKPEKLIRRIIEMATDKNDIVMDFYSGSGTTCAVAHKLGRRYIGIEQLNTQTEKTLERLRSVILGDQSGISKAVKWNGGGSFVYCELAKLNEKYADDIQSADSEEKLIAIWKEMQDTGFISCKIDPKSIKTDSEDFKSLSLKNKKMLLMELLDKNQLYINYCDMDDETFNVSAADKEFSKSFYSQE